MHLERGELARRAGLDPGPEASGWFGSDKADNDALHLSQCWFLGGRGVKPECNFWPRTLPYPFACHVGGHRGDTGCVYGFSRYQ